MTTRNINLCFTKLKYITSSSSPESPCIQTNHSRPFTNPSSSLLIKNFNTLYDDPPSSVPASSNLHSTSDSSPAPTSATLDLSSVFASRRFFFSSPGRSNSIIDSSSSSIASTSSSTSSLHNGNSENDAVSGVAVPTYSPDPFMDFRRSMQEMVDARELHDVKEDWDYLHELLMSYLSLNPKSTHKFIVGAFADLLVSLMTSPSENERRKIPFSDGKCKAARQR